MEVVNETIKALTDSYISFWHSIKKTLEVLSQQRQSILTELTNAVYEAIPEGKWKSYFENCYHFFPPENYKGEKDSFYRLLSDQLPPTAGICVHGVQKKEMLDAGFTSWQEFCDSLEDLNVALKDICIFSRFDSQGGLPVGNDHLTLLFHVMIEL
jgi:hypothetical protein